MRPCVCARVLTRLKRWGVNLCPWEGRLSTGDTEGAWWGHLEKRG
jgi:hypothetical protein